MENIFLKILNISITASWLVLAVLLMRLVLKKAPKWVSVIMWALVGIRLVLPFSFESIFSLIPSAETVPPEILYEQSPALHTGFDAINSAVNPVISESFAPAPGASVNPLQVITYLAGWIWIIGMVAMAAYTLISCLRLRSKLRESAPLQDNIYLCDRIDTPFIFGIFRPKIYLPSAMAGADIPFVLAHEKAHLKRKDHLWKPLGFLLLTVYWFNPLLWLAYILLCRDIEAACDEKVLTDMGDEAKKPYSQALVNCSIPRKMIAACPLAFGEVNVKNRIKKVLSYKKPAFWLLIAAVIVCIVLSVCFLTNPRTLNEQTQIFLDCTIADHFQTDKSQGNACCLDYQVLGTKKNGRETTVYLWVLYEEYSYQNGQLQQETGAHIPTAITATKVDGNYRLVEYWEPRDGSYYPEDIKAKFPIRLWSKALDSQRYIDRQEKACRQLAEEYFAENPPAESPSLSLDIIDTEQAILDYARNLIDAVDYDIDGDGVQELCELHYGPTSGLFTFVLVAYENGQPEYCNIFMSDWGLLSFTEKEDGTIGILRDGNKQNAERIIYDIVIADGHIQLIGADETIAYWGPQGVDAAIYDDWGLRMYLQWEDGNVLNAVFDYHPWPDTTVTEMTATLEYELYVIHNGKRWPFADYVRKILGLKFPAQKATTQWITYTITPDKPEPIPVYLNDLGIDLPAGTYEVVKEVQLRTDRGIQTREYSAQFAIVDESTDATCQRIDLLFFGNPLSRLTIDDPDTCAYLLDLVYDAQARSVLSGNTAGYYGTTYSLEIYWEGRVDPTHFTIWDENYFSVSTQKDSAGYEVFFQADLSQLNHYLQTNYPTELAYRYADSAVSYAGGMSDPLSGIWEESLNPGKLAISSVQHLPVLKFDTLAELEAFKARYPSAIDVTWDEVPSFNTVTAQYDDAFFQNNTLVLVYVPCGNCTYRYDIFSVFYGRDDFSIRVHETTGAEVVEDAEAHWFITVAIPDAVAVTCSTYDAILGDY